MARLTRSDAKSPGGTVSDGGLTLICGEEPRGLLQQLADVETVMLGALAAVGECQAAIAAGGDTTGLAERLADMAEAIRQAAMLRSLWEAATRVETGTRPRHLRSV